LPVAEHFENCRTILLFVQTIFRRVAVRSDGHVKARAVTGRDEVLSPVMIDLAGGKLGDFFARALYLRFAVEIGDAHDRIRIGDIKIMANEGHAKW